MGKTFMSFLRKTTVSILVGAVLLSASSYFARADTNQELMNFLEALITIGVIPAEKADLARTVLNTALSNSSTRINRDLSKGATGDDVKLLQKVLNTNSATVVALSGPGSAGNETTYFGSATEAAVIKFQNFYNFLPTGIVNGATRVKVNALLSVVTNANIPVANQSNVDLKVNGQDDNVQIGSGGTATLMWTSTNVTSCFSGANQPKPLFGTESFTATSSTQLEITCIGPAGIVSDSVTMTVTNNNYTDVNPNSTFVSLGNSSNLNGSNSLNGTTIVIVTPPSTTTSTTTPTPTATTTKSLSILINGVQNYSTTTTSVPSNFGLSWASSGFTVCKFTSNPVITNPADVPIPTTTITAGNAILTTPSNSSGAITFTIACATGTAATNTFNQHTVSSLSSFANSNLMLASSTLTISDPSIPPNPATTTKSLNIYVNGVKNYSTTTSSTLISNTVNWVSTGFSACKITTNPVITNPEDSPASTTATTTVSMNPNGAVGKLTFIIACATGTSITTLDQFPVNLLPYYFTNDPNLMSATSTLNLLSGTTTTATSTINGPADVAKIIGYGPVNHWDTISATSLANQLHTAGLTVTQLELNVNPYTNSRSFSVTMPKLKAFVTAMRAKNIVTDIDIINGKLNDEEGDYICKSLFTDQYYRDILTYINQNIGTSTIILQPVSEWVSGCHDKRDRWIEIFKQNWTGMKSYYVGSHSAPPSSDWFKEYHSSGITDYGNSGELVNTDGGNILNAIGQGGDGLAFADTAKLKAYACHVLLDGTKGFIYYGYGHTAIDSGAITALGELKANMPTSCAALDEEAAVPEEECDPGITVSFSGVVEAVSQCTGEASGYQVIIGSAGNTGSTGSFQSTYSQTNSSCRESKNYNNATALALYSYTNPGLTVGDCVLGSANGNHDATCSSTTPPITCEGVSNGNVKGATGDSGLMAAGVIQQISSGSCGGTTTTPPDNGGHGSNWNWCGQGWCYVIPGVSLIKLYDDIGSGFGLW